MKTTWKGFRSILAEWIQQFIASKRILGRRYAVEEKTLRLFDEYLYAQKVGNLAEVTPDLIEAFLASRARPRPRSYNHLLSTVRRLFDWLKNQNMLDQSPVKAAARRQTSQRIPFIFDQVSARRLLEFAKGLPDNPRATMRGPTYHVIFAILYGLGLRVGEVCRLRLNDVNFNRQVLVIRKTKFYKTRLVPFGPKMAALLQGYHQARIQRLGTSSPDAPFFSFTNRNEIYPGTISQSFHELVPHLKLEVGPGCSPPRLHDLRHSFAVGTLVRWYRSGVDPGAGLLKLATFLGHVNATSTAVYLTMTATLMQEANKRFEAFAEPVFTEGLQR